MGKSHIEEKFKTSRKIQFYIISPIFFVATILLILGEISSQELVWIQSFPIITFSVFYIGGSLIASLYNWSCPQCHKYFGRVINPEFCPHCGVRLQ